MKFLQLIRKIRKSWSSYEPAVEVLISRADLLHNLNEFKKHYSKVSFAPVLKSNAYGHGLIQAAEILDGESCVFFVVDSLFEAMALKNVGINTNILIIGYTSSVNISNCKIKDVAFTITSLEQLKHVSADLKRPTKFHLKVDTGMHRQGISPLEVNEAIELIKRNSLIELEGVCSHLADADGEDETFTKIQINEWRKVVSAFKEKFLNIKYFHLAASAGSAYSNELDCNVARLGIGLYGFNNSPKANLDLRPALQMQSVVSSVKTIQAAEGVGYNLTFKSDKTMRIATVPVGYFEGVDRRLSNLGFFRINGIDCPLVGRVSMNITCVDVSSLPEVKINDKAVIISNETDDLNSTENIAKSIATIPYEILVHIPQHLKRKII